MKKVKHQFKTRTHKGIHYMICRNSIEDKSYWGWPFLKDSPRCTNWPKVTAGTTTVLCSACVNKTVGPPEIKSSYKSTGRLRGWQFMKVFVDKEGNVFHKGKEQPKLKDTLKPTEPKPEKKKLSKLEKSELRNTVLRQLAMTKGTLKAAKFKKDIKAGNIQMRKLERQLKKL